MEKKLGLDLFLAKVKKEDLPERTPIFPRKGAAYKKIKTEIDKLEYELEEIQAPIYQGMLKSFALSSDAMKDIHQKAEEAHTNFRKSFGKEYKEYMASAGPAIAVQGYEAELLAQLCKDVTIQVCKRKVCVDQPVPLSVDDTWVDAHSDGTLTLIRDYDRFKYEDEVFGYSDWNINYHRKSRVHEGAINIMSSTELVEPAKVRQIGVVFQPLLDYRGWPKANGVFAEGGYRPNVFCPRSRGRGFMWITFRVRSKIPGGSWVTRTNYTELYKERPWLASRISQLHAYPPPRSLVINDNYPAGTQFLIEISLSYEIEGNGVEGCAWADYNLEVKPYMNLEACTWEFPESVTVLID